MKRVLTACFAVAFAAGLSAQATPPQAPSAAPAAAEQGQKPKPDPSRKPSSGKPQKPTTPADVTADTTGRAAATVTITGCLAAGDTPNSFVLTNVKTMGAVPMAEPSLSGVPPAAPPGRPAEPPTPPQPQTNPGNPPATPTTPPTAPNPPSNPEAGAPTGTSGGGVPQAANRTIALIGAPASLDLKAHVGHTVRITGAWAPQGKATGKTAAASGRSFNVKSMEHVSAKCGA